MTSPRHVGALLTTVFICQFLVAMDTSLLNVALPSIASGLGFTPAGLQWVVTAYLLTFAGFMLLGGRLGDLYGRRRVVLGGLGLFIAASLLATLAWSPGALITARAVQGLAGAAISPASLAIINANLEGGSLRRRAMALWGGAGAVGGAVGVVLSGVLAQSMGWRAVLAVNLPIGLVALWAAGRGVTETRDEHADRHLDVPGALLVTAGVAALVWGVSSAEHHGWSSPIVWGMGLSGLVLLAGFVLRESRTAHPLMPLRVFRIRRVVGANLFSFFLSAGQLAAFYFCSLFIQQVWGVAPTIAGVLFLPFCAFIGLGIALAGKLVPAVGTRWTLVILGLLGSMGLAGFALMPTDMGVWRGVILPSLFAATGIGGGLVAVGKAATEHLAQDLAGLASGVLNSSRQLGGTFGLSVLVSLSVMGAEHSAAGGSLALADGYHLGLGVGAAFLVLGAVLALCVVPRRGADTPQR